MYCRNYIYSVTWNTKRKKFKIYGEAFQGYILGAEEKETGRGENVYYLLISFNDNGEKN